MHLSALLEEGIIKLREEVPQELVVRMFQRLVRFVVSFLRYKSTFIDDGVQNLHQILFTKHGGLFAGMMTKRDIVQYVQGRVSASTR